MRIETDAPPGVDAREPVGAERLTPKAALALVRYHIVAVAVVATLVFGWLMTGRHPWAAALWCGIDWFFVNLLNRVTDVEEDRKNAIPGAGWMAGRQRPALWLTLGALAASFVVGHLLAPALTPWRVGVQLIGLGYSLRLVPTLSGLKRFKEIYFLKNFMSSVIFVLTGFAYPLVVLGTAPTDLSWAGTVTLVLFFVPFELTYEILYDLRDLEGDRAEGVPTYPVVHGPAVARRIIDGLLLTATAVLGVGLLMGFVGLREGLMLAAPAVQLAFYRPRYRRGLTGDDCIRLTHLGTGLLVVYLAGTVLWQAAGLPPNIWL